MTQNQPSQSKPQQTYKSPANFIEALKEASSDIAKGTVKGITGDLIGGVVQQTADTLFGGSSSNNNGQNQNEDNFNFEELLRENNLENQRAMQHKEVQRTYESREVEIFNQRNKEIEQRIEAVRIEIQKLAREVVNLDSSTESVIAEELVNPGTYHLNFFEKLLKFIQFLRKKVVESRHWAATHQGKQTKSYYWQQANSKVSGTKFMLSSERSVVTQTG